MKKKWGKKAYFAACGLRQLKANSECFIVSAKCSVKERRGCVVKVL